VLRGWLQLADAAGVGRRFPGARARILVRILRSAVRGGPAGLTDHGMSTEETPGPLVDQDIAEGADGRVVAARLRRAVLVADNR
jgi:hypothetical protein